MANNILFKIKTGEDKTMSFTILDGTNTEVSLTNKSVYFTMSQNGTAVISLAFCTPDPDQVTNKGKGTYLFTQAVTEDLTAGVYDGEFCVVDADSKNLFYPNDEKKERDYFKIIVSKSLAIPA